MLRGRCSSRKDYNEHQADARDRRDGGRDSHCLPTPVLIRLRGGIHRIFDSEVCVTNRLPDRAFTARPPWCRPVPEAARCFRLHRQKDRLVQAGWHRATSFPFRSRRRRKEGSQLRGRRKSSSSVHRLPIRADLATAGFIRHVSRFRATAHRPEYES